jgi:PAS domain S-box-containing protein
VGTPNLTNPVRLLLLMAVAIAVDLGFQRLTNDRAPGLFLLPAVILAGSLAGTRAAFAAAAVTVLFSAIDLSETGPLWRPPYDRAARLAVLCVTAPTVAVVVGVLRRRVHELTAERVEAERSRATAAVGRAFATERHGLERQRDALVDTDRQNQRRLADLIAAVPGVVWEAAVEADGELRVVFISRFVQDLLGYDVRRWTESRDLWWTAIHADDRDRVRQWIAAACGNRTAAAPHAAPAEYRWVAESGAIVWVETRLSVVPGPDGQGRCVAVRGVTSDITARHRLEHALNERAIELDAVARRLRESNDELDQFAYVTSHDLKAPLRGISNLSNWIEEDLGPDRLTAEARGQFNLLRGRVQRMEKLIDGLLQYSRVGRTATEVEWVDVAQLMDEVIDWVAPPPTVRIDVGPDMPSFNADRLRLGQVLANLVGNAVKHGPAQGVIHVTCRPVADDLFEFAVADDGPGIDPRYHERIFGVFQTLNRRDKVEGTGIGLALVRKVVLAKGGTVRVDSLPDRGATFRFTWPRVDPTAAVPSPQQPDRQKVVT